MEPYKLTLDNKEYSFRVLGALEYDEIVDTSQSQTLATRRHVAASTNLTEKELGDLDRPTYSRLVVEFQRLHSPKGFEELLNQYMPSLKQLKR